MSLQKISPLSEELSGIWILRPPSQYYKQILRLFRLCTSVIFMFLIIKVIFQLDLVPVAVLLISGTIIIVLEIYTPRIPYVVIPLNHLIVIICVTYMYIYSLFSQQQFIFEAINFSILPDIVELLLGLVILVRIVAGIELTRLTKRYEYARTPLSKNPLKSLQTFETNLQLTTTALRDEFSEEPLYFKLKAIFSYIFIAVSILSILLLPMWMVMLEIEGIYPYILLIPSTLIILLMLVYLPPKNTNSEKN